MGLPDVVAGTSLPQMVWDVDNDGDGIADSIWIDIGLPIQTDATGRRYRPLVAILCEDLDGRLNVNAHSSPAHNSNLYADMSSWPGIVPLQIACHLRPPSPLTPFAGNGVRPRGPHTLRLLLPRGLGVGPADIFLGHLLGPVDFANVLTQRYRHDVTVIRQCGWDQ